MAEELVVVLRRSDDAGFGFSLLGKPGLPPIIYNVADDSPAAECGEVEIGDVILKVNETDVNRFSTKEVLKCLRLSSDPVTLRIKRDPKIKATLRKHLATSQGGGDDGDTAVVRNKISTALTKTTSHHIHNNTTGGELTSSTRTNGGGGGGSLPENEPLLADHFEEQERLQWEPLAANESFRPKGPPKFEAYMMTGEHILNISRAPQQKKLAGGRAPHECRNNHAHLLRHNHHNSLPNSPKEADFGYHHQHEVNNRSATASPVSKPYAGSCATSVRTSRSEDQLQQKEGLSAVDIDVDDDLTSSLNTLLDTRTEENSDRIVWTYNAPVDQRNGSSSGESSLRSSSPASPTTSVSSSVMSSQSGSMRMAYTLTNGPPATANGGDCSVSEAVSNISSPDYRDDDSMGMRDCVMEISDHSDSDSTLLVSEPRQRPSDGDHKIVIQVKGPEELRGRGRTGGRKEDGFRRFQEEHGDYDQQTSSENPPSPPPHYPEDDSDVESLHSFHYSPKAVDLPSAIRLAKRLYSLDGFKKSDVSRHLSKNNDFSRAVADEYLKYFDFSQDTLDIALRKFLKQFSLTGETQERERVLVHFSKRYLDCNPGSFNSQDAVHTLTCAIMLLNTDLHGQNLNRKMTCNEFIENLAGLNEGENFPREVLKQLYHAIKNPPLEWALDDDVEVTPSQQMEQLGTNPFLDMPFSTNAIEYKKGYVMRKCCYEANAKKTPFHKRNWKMFYCTLRDLVLYLHKDENGFRKNQMGDNLHNAIRIHHALATKATDYTKKQYVFRLQTADQAEYLFQTSDSKELQSWIDTINFVCASFSAPPLEAAVGSQKKFQRPLLPCSHTRLSLREQLRDHEERVARLETELDEHRKSPPEKGAKSLVIQNYKEKEAYLNYELKRFRAYAYILRTRMVHYAADMMPAGGQSLTEESEEGGVTFLEGGQAGGGVVPPPIPDRRSPPATNRFSSK